MTIYDPYGDMYYDYGYDTDSSVIIGGGGSGGSYVTKEEMNNAINNALSNISVQRIDDDSIALNINGKLTEPIDDVYLTSVTRDDSDEDDKKVLFNLNNGKSPISVDLSELDDPNIDCSTF
jgi:hypothetical protein